MNQLAALDEILGITATPYLPKSRALPFLKWAGGKRSIIPQIRGFVDGEYVSG